MLLPLAARNPGLGPLAQSNAEGPSTLLSGLTSYWRMEEASGTRYDAVGANHWDNGAAGQASGIIGNAADMSGASGQWLYHSCGYLSTEHSITIAQWQYRSTIPIVCLICAAPNSSNAALYVYYQGSFGGGRLQVIAYDSVAGSSSASFLGGGSTDAWRLMVFGYDASTRRAFASVDGGTLVYGVPLANGLKVASAVITQMGRSSGAGYQATRSDEMALWANRALTQDEMIELYNGGAGIAYPF